VTSVFTHFGRGKETDRLGGLMADGWNIRRFRHPAPVFLATWATTFRRYSE
jgi:hypothetical protein